MPALPLNKIEAGKVGRDIIIREDHFLLALQHAFIRGKYSIKNNVERAGWEQANIILKQIIENKEKNREDKNGKI
ncbi:MAG: hypothetical protein IKE41_02340 [Clostridia bacterium]|nr:hypothetical protein [Clostridia bacterium]